MPIHHDGDQNEYTFDELKTAICKALNEGSEQKAIDLVNHIFAKYGDEFLFGITFNYPSLPSYAKSKYQTPPQSTLLAIACSKQYKHLAVKLIELGAPIDVGIMSPDFMDYHQDSPLMLACEKDDLDLVSFLLDHGANLLHKNGFGADVLMWVQSGKMCDLLLQYAEKQGVMDELIRGSNLFHQTAFTHMCRKGLVDVAGQLLNRINLDALEYAKRSNILRDMLHHVTVASWDYPEKLQAFNQLRQQIKEKMQHDGINFPRSIKEFDTDYSSLNEQEAYSKLFGDVFPETTPDNKNEAVRKAIAQIYSLLDSPQECIPYLQFLNEEFSRYYREKYKEDFGSLNADSYEFKNINGMYFPTPGAHYKGLEKKGALQEFLISLLREQGIAENAYKWVGYIPHEVADKMVANGDFVMESRLGSGLFHYKVAHMLQQAMIAYAMQGGRIHTTFMQGGKLMQITHQDILQGLVTMQDQFGEVLWIVVRDRLDMSEVKFSDPNRMCSVMMRHGRELGIENLSNYMIDNCCRGVIHLLDALNQMNTEQVGMTMNELVSCLSDVLTHSFHMSFKLQRYAMQHSLKHELDKGKLTQEDASRVIAGNDYVVVPKKYHPNLLFKPKPFVLSKQDQMPSRTDESKSTLSLNKK